MTAAGERHQPRRPTEEQNPGSEELNYIGPRLPLKVCRAPARHQRADKSQLKTSTAVLAVTKIHAQRHRTYTGYPSR